MREVATTVEVGEGSCSIRDQVLLRFIAGFYLPGHDSHHHYSDFILDPFFWIIPSQIKLSSKSAHSIARPGGARPGGVRRIYIPAFSRMDVGEGSCSIRDQADKDCPSRFFYPIITLALAKAPLEANSMGLMTKGLSGRILPASSDNYLGIFVFTWPRTFIVNSLLHVSSTGLGNDLPFIFKTWWCKTHRHPSPLTVPVRSRTRPMRDR
ncbi:uncharacterized protein LACBIDRAFT_331843 [Laccaria bicolor S238N-H82]|uniref:Predicted protein n=1 Tax=Laccaria bicolor (strain S238N-H82 / ATCC MYA-4686) TaxID=486041 RepID=B0DQR1_LACBS|nr:uncharacterized protein LACBIDRAFT_331843 [Laccaria bicolor S238N-H82]EDR03075.1 predicted protein [Laccaria bicolor S238N-H82]|eukprot:XP_001886216.1 predicted protein [Laccaria bicolor S238N-H82]